jgi:hypothetical protein
MEPSAHSNEKDQGKWTQRLWKKAKAIMSGLCSAPLASVTKASRTEGTRTAQIPPAGTNATLETSSHAGIASTVKEENTTSTIDPVLNPPSNSIGPFTNTVAATPGSASDLPGAPPTIAPTPSQIGISSPGSTEPSSAVENTPGANNLQSTTNEPAPNSSMLPPGKFEPLYNVGPAIAVPLSGAARSALSKDESAANSAGPHPNPQIALAEPTNGFVTAPSASPASTVVQTAQPQLWLRTKNAPIWNAVLETLKEKYPEMYQELEKTKSCLTDSRERKTDELFKLDIGKPEEKAIVQRMKQYLPSLAAVRGIAMAAAAWDPHKVAPIVCACVFFSIDVRSLFVYRKLTNRVSLRSIIFRRRQKLRCEISFSKASLLSMNGSHLNQTSQRKAIL